MARRTVWIMGCQNQRGVLFARLFQQQRHHRIRQSGMHTRRWFIRQQNLRAMR
jgi:hypothetical protein